MKFIRLRLQWNTRYFHRIIRVEEWKKLIQLRLFSSNNTCWRIIRVEEQKKCQPWNHRASIAVKHALFSSKDMCQHWNQFIQLRLQWNTRYFHRIIRVENERSSSSFDYSETCVIFIEVYVSTVKSVHPTSIAVKHALFSSNNTRGRMKEDHPASIIFIE